MPAVASPSINGYLYRHIRLDKNEPFYIGIGFSHNKYAREGLYRSKTKKGRNKIWKDIVNKSNYEIEILLEDLQLDKLMEKEIEFIKLYGRIDQKTGTLANMTNGGQGTLGSKHNLGKKHSDETKAKISKNRKGLIISEETKKKLSIANLKRYSPYHEGLKCKIIEYDMNMNYVKEHESIRNTKNYGFDPRTVSKCLKGKRKQHKGSIFKYKSTI